MTQKFEASYHGRNCSGRKNNENARNTSAIKNGGGFETGAAKMKEVSHSPTSSNIKNGLGHSPQNSGNTTSKTINHLHETPETESYRQRNGLTVSKNDPFPRKLMALLHREKNSTVGWLPDGDAFVVRDMIRFEEKIIPLYFRQTKMKSFQHQLLVYGFQRIAKGPNTETYRHDLFRRDQPEVCLYMWRRKCPPTRRASRKKNKDSLDSIPKKTSTTISTKEMNTGKKSESEASPASHRSGRDNLKQHIKTKSVIASETDAKADCEIPSTEQMKVTDIESVVAVNPASTKNERMQLSSTPVNDGVGGIDVGMASIRCGFSETTMEENSSGASRALGINFGNAKGGNSDENDDGIDLRADTPLSDNKENTGSNGANLICLPSGAAVGDETNTNAKKQEEIENGKDVIDFVSGPSSASNLKVKSSSNQTVGGISAEERIDEASQANNIKPKNAKDSCSHYREIGQKENVLITNGDVDVVAVNEVTTNTGKSSETNVEQKIKDEKTVALQLINSSKRDSNSGTTSQNFGKAKNIINNHQSRTQEPVVEFNWNASAVVGCPLFPRKLMEMLANEESSVVGWVPEGDAFVVRNKDLFVKEVMPRYFRQSKIQSFHRQLNLYGFRFITKGAEAGAFYHEYFHRDDPKMCVFVTRQKTKGPRCLHMTRQQLKGLRSGPTQCLSQRAPFWTTAATANSISDEAVESTRTRVKLKFKYPKLPEGESEHTFAAEKEIGPGWRIRVVEQNRGVNSKKGPRLNHFLIAPDGSSFRGKPAAERYLNEDLGNDFFTTSNNDDSKGAKENHEELLESIADECSPGDVKISSNNANDPDEITMGSGIEDGRIRESMITDRSKESRERQMSDDSEQNGLHHRQESVTRKEDFKDENSSRPSGLDGSIEQSKNETEFEARKEETDNNAELCVLNVDAEDGESDSCTRKNKNLNEENDSKVVSAVMSCLGKIWSEKSPGFFLPRLSRGSINLHPSVTSTCSIKFPQFCGFADGS